MRKIGLSVSTSMLMKLPYASVSIQPAQILARRKDADGGGEDRRCKAVPAPLCFSLHAMCRFVGRGPIWQNATLHFFSPVSMVSRAAALAASTLLLAVGAQEAADEEAISTSSDVTKVQPPAGQARCSPAITHSPRTYAIPRASFALLFV